MSFEVSKTALNRAVEPYLKQGYVHQAEAGRRMGCAGYLVKNRIGEPLKVISTGSMKAILYHESQVEAYLNKSSCANCVE